MEIQEKAIQEAVSYHSLSSRVADLHGELHGDWHGGDDQGVPQEQEQVD